MISGCSGSASGSFHGSEPRVASFHVSLYIQCSHRTGKKDLMYIMAQLIIHAHRQFNSTFVNCRLKYRYFFFSIDMFSMLRNVCLFLERDKLQKRKLLSAHHPSPRCILGTCAATHRSWQHCTQVSRVQPFLSARVGVYFVEQTQITLFIHLYCHPHHIYIDL